MSVSEIRSQRKICEMVYKKSVPIHDIRTNRHIEKEKKTSTKRKRHRQRNNYENNKTVELPEE